MCSLEKRFYNADFAHKEYREVLSESTTGISYFEDDIRCLNEFISPLIRKKQSPRHICMTNADSIAELMPAFIHNHNDSRSVIDILERLYLELRPDRFC